MKNRILTLYSLISFNNSCGIDFLVIFAIKNELVIEIKIWWFLIKLWARKLWVELFKEVTSKRAYSILIKTILCTLYHTSCPLSVLSAFICTNLRRPFADGCVCKKEVEKNSSHCLLILLLLIQLWNSLLYSLNFSHSAVELIQACILFA